MADINKIKKYFTDRVNDLKKYASDEKPWIFLCATAFLEYVARMVVNKANQKDGFCGNDYKQFIRDYLATINQKYLTFQYKNGKRDLPDQIYHILRCGMVHAFSLIPDKETKKRGGRERSIILYHRKSKKNHLSNYSSKLIKDAVVFIAEDFVGDIKKLVEEIFRKTASDKKLKSNIENYFNKYPPISGEVK